MGDERNIVVKVDRSGNCLPIREFQYKGEAITYRVFLEKPDKLITSLEHFTPRKDDIWILSFAKSGCHWLYEIMGILLKHKLEPLAEFKEEAFVEHSENGMEHFDHLPSPRILNTHFRLKFMPESVLTQNKIVCVIRNPKSVCVSRYYHERITFHPDRLGYTGSFSDYLPLWTEGLCSLEGSWFEYTTECWKQLHGRPNLLFLYYEAMKQDPLKAIEEVAMFLGLERTREFCKGVAELTSIKKMIAAEQKNMTEKNTKVKQLFRKGSTTDWKHHFTVAENELFDSVYEEEMKHYPELRDKIMFS